MSMEEAKHLARELGMDEDGAELAKQFGMGNQPPEEIRDLDVITQEIVFYKRQAGASIIEIGKRLNEAKEQLGHGEWLPWLREKVDISERSATNFMRLAREYSKSAEIADLGASKALALLTLPESERADFVAEKHVVDGKEKSVADMTGQELTKALKERDEAVQAQREAVKAAEQSDKQRIEISGKLTELQERIKEDREELEKKLRAAKIQAQEAKAAAENAGQEKMELERKLKKLADRPVEVAVAEPSQETMDKLRKEAEKRAEEKIKEANAQLMQAQAESEKAAEEVKNLRKQLEMTDKDTQAFAFYFDEIQHRFNAMMGTIQNVEKLDAGKAGKLKNAVKAVLTKWSEAV